MPSHAIEVGFDHFGDHLFERDLRSPAELVFRFCRVAMQIVDFRWPEIPLIDDDVIFHFQSDMGESQHAKNVRTDLVRPVAIT